MSFKKTLLGIMAIPLVLTLAYNSANYVNAKTQGRDAPGIVVPNIYELDPVMLVGFSMGAYSAYRNSRRKENERQ